MGTWHRAHRVSRAGTARDPRGAPFAGARRLKTHTRRRVSKPSWHSSLENVHPASPVVAPRKRATPRLTSASFSTLLRDARFPVTQK
jgi:hypothetical protein